LHSDLLESDGDASPFLIDRGTKDVHVVTSDCPLMRHPSRRCHVCPKQARHINLRQ